MSVNYKNLELFRDEIRLLTLKELFHLGFGHYGGSLSIIEVLSVLYGEVMKVDPGNPQWEIGTILSYQKDMAAHPFMQLCP
ncbi:hypothetical protein ACN6MY_11750 [Peribacillus sp. B-H-3]|uniref:hypothetical protein n=1 Tax=Peribacillus sp. B-H-3 TaxID=3400420 RepID=UPI003B020F50